MGTVTTLAETLASMDEGEMLALPDGRSLRYKVDIDYGTEINDFDYLGKTSVVERDGRFGCYKQATRPREFDGNARIIEVYGGGNASFHRVWWQPPTDWHTLTPEVQRGIAKTVKDVLEFGYQAVTLELCDGLDAYKRPVVVRAEATGAVEPWSYDDRAVLLDALGFLVGEMLADDNDEVTA